MRTQGSAVGPKYRRSKDLGACAPGKVAARFPARIAARRCALGKEELTCGATASARGERGAGQRAVREGGSLRLPGGPRTVGVHAPGGRRGERDAAGASGASARVAGRAGGARGLSHQGRKGGSGPLRGSDGPSGELGRAREGEGAGTDRARGERSRPRTGLARGEEKK